MTERAADPRPTRGCSPYPRYFVTPAGKKVSIAAMARALQLARANPHHEFRGWEWFETPGHWVTRSFMRGLHERINSRAVILREAGL